MSHAHPLDRPVWSALASRQRGLALGDDLARRFAPEFGPFGAAADSSAASEAAVLALNPVTGGLVLVEDAHIAPPAGAAVALQAEVHQMVAKGLVSGAAALEAEAFGAAPLAEADAPDMRALAALAQPGPFSTRTHQLGEFFGIRRDGVLAAMAGERMQPDGFCEVSGVCTHPDWRGHGYGGRLTRLIANRIVARGETPFLHVMATNAGAISLYQTLGFVFRRSLAMTVLGPNPPAA